MSHTNKPKIFISYSHDDEEWKNLVKKHFTASGKFDIWNDKDIKLGEKWFENIKNSLHEADIALLLITENFLNSEFIKNNEIPDLIEACENGKVQVVTFIIRSCPFEHLNSTNQCNI